jgi:hypothetical protein
MVIAILDFLTKVHFEILILLESRLLLLGAVAKDFNYFCDGKIHKGSYGGVQTEINQYKSLYK